MNDKILRQMAENLKVIVQIDTDEIRIRNRNEDEDYGFAKAYGELSSKVKEAKEIAALAAKQIEKILENDEDF